MSTFRQLSSSLSIFKGSSTAGSKHYMYLCYSEYLSESVFVLDED
jgi:hypothetical protein